jgi:chemotaxis-related protein WspD
MLKEVTSDRPSHTLPHRRTGIVRGLTNIRGELLVCIALERLLTSQPLSPTSGSDKPSAATRLLVLQSGSGCLVCCVDEVHGVERFAAHALKEAPTNPAKSRASYLRAVVSWNEKTIGVLDESRLLQTVEESLPLVAKS